MIAAGSTNASKVYLGSEEISKIYLGSTQIWGGSSPTPPTPVLPYDAEVEYLETDGWCYINTNYVPVGNTKVDVKWMSVTDDIEITVPYCPIGGGIAFANKYFGLWAPTNQNYRFFPLRGNSNNGYDTSSRVSLLDKVNTCVFANNTSTVNLNNKNYTVATTSVTDYSIPLWLFASNVNNNTPSSNQHKLRLYYADILEGSTYVRQFIPVRVGTTGYMYDKVSGTLFGNANSSGAFTFGNDVTT